MVRSTRFKRKTTQSLRRTKVHFLGESLTVYTRDTHCRVSVHKKKFSPFVWQKVKVWKRLTRVALVHKIIILFCKKSQKFKIARRSAAQIRQRKRTVAKRRTNTRAVRRQCGELPEVNCPFVFWRNPEIEGKKVACALIDAYVSKSFPYSRVHIWWWVSPRQV